jgi:ABC-type protease/lipase transport system fused ATPase/permease subunit
MTRRGGTAHDISLGGTASPAGGRRAALSFFLNLLFLIRAIFMLQVFDRVVPGDGKEALLVGTCVARAPAAVDDVRTRLQASQVTKAMQLQPQAIIGEKAA